MSDIMRRLLLRKAFAATVLLTISLGIGANTVIFSAVNGVLVRSLPYPNADRLVHIWAFWPGGAGNISFPDGVAIAERSRTIEASSVYQAYGSVALTGHVPAENLNPSFVTPSYFEMLGARASSGRLFLATDDAEGAPGNVVVLSHGFWEREFGARPQIVGETIQLNGLKMEVIGVLEDSFADLAPVDGPPADLFLPTVIAPQLMGQTARTESLRLYWGLARLKPGVSLRAAEEDVATVARQMEVERPATHRGYGLKVQTLSDRIRGAYRTPVLLLLTGAVFVLLIGCANVANLFLLRLTERRQELAVRAALGASSDALFRLVLSETLVLAGAGGVLGALLGAMLTGAMSRWTTAHVSQMVDVSLAPMPIAAAILMSGLVCVGIAALIARHTRAGDWKGGLSSGSRSQVEGGRGRVRQLLMAAEVAFALVLLSGAGLMARSFHRLTTTPLGFDTNRLLTFRMDLTGPRYQDSATRVQLVDAFLDRARGVAGVQSATVWGPSMLANATWVVNVSPAEQPRDRPDSFTMLFRHSVNPGGLDALGIERIQGRDFNPTDAADRPLVAIVSESAAKGLWPGQNPIGKQLTRTTPGLPPIHVIGVARDVRHRQRYSLSDIAEAGFIGGLGPQRDIYLPFAQRSNNGVTFAVRLSGSMQGVLQGLRKAGASLDPDLPLSDPRLLDDRIADQERIPKALAGLLLVSAVFAFLLASTGIYGVVAQIIGRRTREIGLRVALGAGRAHIVRLVVSQGLTPVTAGAVVGFAASLALSRSLSSILFEVTAGDPLTFFGVAVSLAVVAVLAIVIPTRRALAIDPTVALRAE